MFTDKLILSITDKRETSSMKILALLPLFRSSRPFYLSFFLKNLKKPVRSSRSEVFCKRDALRNFAKFTGKHLRQSLFLNKVAIILTLIFSWPATLLKKETLAQVLPCEFCEIFKNTFSYRRPPMAASGQWHYLNITWCIIFL